MADAGLDLPTRLTRDEFRRWEDSWPGDRRFERIDWRPVPMPPERSGRALVKAAVWRTLNDAIRKAGVACTAYPDGMTVEVDDATDYLPDALVDAGPPIPLDDVGRQQPGHRGGRCCPPRRRRSTGARNSPDISACRASSTT